MQKNLEPLAQELVAPRVPTGAGRWGVGSSGSATTIVLDVAVGLGAIGILVPALLSSGSVGVTFAGLAAGVGVAQAPCVLGLAGILAGIGEGTLAVGRALAELLVVKELEWRLGALAGIVVAANAGELVAADCFGTGPGGGHSAHAG